MDKDKFFEVQRNLGLALTYDDVRLETGPSDVSASEVDITSRISTNVELKVPIASAAMDTVTTSRMAIAMAKMGGIGVIHNGLSTKEQRSEVRRTKLHLNGLVENPITVRADESISTVLEMCDQRDFDFRTFPVIDENQKFVGILTSNDFKFAQDTQHPVSEVMTLKHDVLTGNQSTDANRAYELMHEQKKGTLPILREDGTVAGLYLLSDVERIVQGNPQRYNLDDKGRLRTAIAVPTSPEAFERVQEMIDYTDVVIIDTAQGDSKFALKALIGLREAYADLDIVIGNISSPRSVELLIENGADGIKVGQGPGSICTTRPETGIGMPQVTAIYECARAARDINSDIPICADGGITSRGDISIAMAVGADSVMIGSKLAGTDEAPGEVVTRGDGKRTKKYRGMGSKAAMESSANSRQRYDANNGGVILPEGVEAEVDYKGTVVNEIALMEQALRKSMSYCGAETIAAHQANTPIWRITNAGLRESLSHDVIVTSS